MKLYDCVHGHEVGTVNCDVITSRWGDSYQIDGYAVIDVSGIVGERGNVVGIFDDGRLYVRNNLMAQVAS